MGKKDLPAGSLSSNDRENHYADVDNTPTVLFEKYFGDDVIEILVNNINKYARSDKGKLSFETSCSEMRVFLAILFTSSYAP